MSNTLERLVERLKNDDLSALGEVYSLLSKKIYNRCFFILKDEQLAEDCTQEIFLKAFQQIKTISEGAKIDAWMNRMAYNYCIDILRKRKRIAEVDIDNVLNTEDQLSLVEELDTLENSEGEVDSLRSKIAELKETDRIILLMHYWEGYTVAEIAESLDIGLSSVKMKLKRTREKLKSELLQDGITHTLEVAILVALNLI